MLRLTDDPLDTLLRPETRAAPHAIVIGSGFGGLAAAVRLGARGYRVTVLEKLDQPGGRARVFRQDGFTFDAGPTIITAPFLFDELWEMCGKKREDHVDLRPVDPFYRIRFDSGESFDYSGDADAMRRRIACISPAEVAGYDRFMEASREICRVGFEELGHVSFGSLKDMLRVVPDLMRLQGYRSVYGLVSRYFKDERLRTIFSFHPLLVGGNPFRTTSVYALISHLERHWGVHYAVGGTNRLVTGLVDLIEGQGGSVRCDTAVAEITLDGRRATGVRLESGEEIPAAIVVSNADSAWTYRHLVPAHARKRWTDAKIARSRYSMSLFVWYFGTSKRYEDVEHHTILLGPRYRELLRDIFDRKILAEDFSLYLHRPTASDPSLAPDGCDSFYVLSPVPHLEADIDWTQRAESYRLAVSRYLEAALLPDLEENIVTSRIMTPVHFRDELSSVNGAAFGLEPIMTQSAWVRPHNSSEDIDGLYLVGPGTHPGAGLPGVLSSARVLDQVVPHAHALA